MQNIHVETLLAKTFTTLRAGILLEKPFFFENRVTLLMGRNNPKKQTLAQALEGDLLQLYRAAVIGGKDLQTALGYRTAIAFRVAMSRERLGVPVFKIPGRKGHWALVKDISLWMAAARQGADHPGPDSK